jgi:hypothetical protein
MIPARGARTALETGINDGGYRVSSARQKIFTVLPTVLLAIPATVVRRRQNFTVA